MEAEIITKMEAFGLTGDAHTMQTDDGYIARVEDLIGAPLGPSYSSFLKRFGSSVFQEDVEFEVPTGADGIAAIDSFFGASTNSGSDLFENVLANANRLPPDVIAIAHEPFGGLICLGTQGARAGKVYFWDNSLEDPSAKTRDSNLHRVGDSFDEFIQLLRLTPP